MGGKIASSVLASEMISEFAAAKAAGALAGAILALAFIPPRSWRALGQRALVAVVFGFVFEPISREWIGFQETGEGVSGAAAAAAFASWWIMTAVKRAVDIWQGPKPPE